MCCNHTYKQRGHSESKTLVTGQKQQAHSESQLFLCQTSQTALSERQPDGPPSASTLPSTACDQRKILNVRLYVYVVKVQEGALDSRGFLQGAKPYGVM